MVNYYGVCPILEEVNFINFLHKPFHLTLRSFKVGILYKGTINIEIPNLLSFYRVLNERDLLTGNKVVTCILLSGWAIPDFLK